MNKDQKPIVLTDQPETPTACPTCGAGQDKFGPSGGFGAPSLICLKCGTTIKEKA